MSDIPFHSQISVWAPSLASPLCRQVAKSPSFGGGILAARSRWLRARSGHPVWIGEEVAPGSHAASGGVSSGAVTLGSGQEAQERCENLLERLGNGAVTSPPCKTLCEQSK